MYKRMNLCQWSRKMLFFLSGLAVLAIFPLWGVASDLEKTESPGTNPEVKNWSTVTNKARAFTVKGVVSDADGPLAGVTVVEKGTTNGTSTNNYGEYQLEVSGSDATLVFSYIGYESQEISANGKSTINVELVTGSKQLSGVVVTALGIEREERSLGYAVGSVDGDDLRKVNHENILTGLSGKVPGVSIKSSGGLGSSVSMVIRGATSLVGDNQPLFVIDGTPINNSMNNVGGFDGPVDYGNAISDLDPDDIKNISILKGPSAAALYGSRAGNGVVLITTKKGTKHQGLGVSVSTSTVFDIPHKISPIYYSRFAQGIRPYTPDNRPGGGDFKIAEAEANWVGPELDKGYSAIRWNSPLDENGNPIPLPLVSYDNPSAFFQTGITNSNNVSVSNAKEDIAYRLSFTNMNGKGMVPNTDLYKNNVNFSTDFNLASNFSISAVVNYTNNKSNNRPAGDRGANPLQALADLNPSVDIRELRDYWVEGKEGIEQKTFAPDKRDNPYFLAYEATNAFERNRIYGNINAKWQLTPELSIKGQYGLDRFDESRKSKIPMSYSGFKNGGFGIQKLSAYERNTEVLVNYRKRVSDFDFDISVGGNFMHRENTNFKNTTNKGGLVISDLYNLNNIIPENLSYSNYFSGKSIYSVYGLASIGFKDIAYLDLTARNDWSSTLPVDNRSYFYPSASLSLLLSEMFHTSSDISLIKIRGGIAQVGKDTDPYQLEPVLSNSGTWPGGVSRLSTSQQLLNIALKPEIATSYEGGIDLGFLNNRLRLNGTYYVSDNVNQILNIAMPSSSGYTSKLINAGKVRSQGVELILGITPTAPSSELQWDINLNFSKNRTKIVRLTEDIDHFVLWEDAKGGAWTYEGETIGDLYDRQLVTVEDENSPYYGYPLIKASGGWQDKGGGQENAEKIGNFNPDFTMGLQTALSFKGFTLSASLDWRSGGDFVSQTYRYAESDLHGDQFLERYAHNLNDVSDLPQFLKDHAEEYIYGINVVGGPTKEVGGFEYREGGVTLHDGVFNPGVYQVGTDSKGDPIYEENLGDPSKTKYIRYGDNYPWGFTRVAMFPASFVKLRELSISYAFPQEWYQKIGLQNVNLSVFTRNVILWTKANAGIDPENAFQPTSSGTAGGANFKEGIERYNVLPWKLPVGFKLSFNF